MFVCLGKGQHWCHKIGPAALQEPGTMQNTLAYNPSQLPWRSHQSHREMLEGIRRCCNAVAQCCCCKARRARSAGGATKHTSNWRRPPLPGLCKDTAARVSYLPCQLLFPLPGNESPRCMGAHGKCSHPGQALDHGWSPVRENQLEEENCRCRFQAPRSLYTGHSLVLRHVQLSSDND